MNQSFLKGKSQPQDHSLPLIIAFVLAVHALACAWIVLFAPPLPHTLPKQAQRRLTVQTVSLKSPQRPSATTSIATATPTPTALPAAAPAAENIATADIAPPQPAPPPRAPKAKAASPPAVPPPAKKITPSPKPTTPPPAKKAPPQKPAATVPNPKGAPPHQSATKPTPAKPAVAAQAAADKSTAEVAQKKLADEQAVQARAAKARQLALISQAQERIAKIGRSHDKMTPGATAVASEMSLPGPISQLKVDDVSEEGTVLFGGVEASYRDELAGRMQLLLRLPEYGDVKMKLTLERSGKVAKVVITSAQSTNNRSYIEKTVPTLSFSPFGSHFGTESQHTFSITLSNDL